MMTDTQSYAQSASLLGKRPGVDATDATPGSGLPGTPPLPMKGAPVPPRNTSPTQMLNTPSAFTSRFHSEESRLATPVQLLSEVAEHGVRLRSELVQLVVAITGETPPAERIRDVPRLNGGLLPNIMLLAHEIEQTQAECAKLIKHVRGRI